MIKKKQRIKMIYLTFIIKSEIREPSWVITKDQVHYKQLLIFNIKDSNISCKTLIFKDLHQVEKLEHRLLISEQNQFKIKWLAQQQIYNLTTLKI